MKNLPTFNGNKRTVQAWIDDVEDCLRLFQNYAGQPVYNQIIRAIKNKITDGAREAIIAAGNPNNWNEIKNALLNAYGDKRDLTSYIQNLFRVTQGNKPVTDYYNKIKNLETCIKTNIALMEEYKNSIPAIQKLISLITLTRFIDGLGENLSMSVRSHRPETLDEALSITMQYSNASYRQKLDRQVIKKEYHDKQIAGPSKNHQNSANQYSNNQKTMSVKFKSDGDVSMRTARSHNQMHNHEGEKTEATDDEFETIPQRNETLLESDDDEFFVGEEINFQVAQRIKPAK